MSSPTHGKDKGMTDIGFRAEPAERTALKVLCRFFKLPRRARLLHTMLALVLIDVAALPENYEWTTAQLNAWKWIRAKVGHSNDPETKIDFDLLRELRGMK